MSRVTLNFHKYRGINNLLPDFSLDIYKPSSRSLWLLSSFYDFSDLQLAHKCLWKSSQQCRCSEWIHRGERRYTFYSHNSRLYDTLMNVFAFFVLVSRITKYIYISILFILSQVRWHLSSVLRDASVRSGRTRAFLPR